MIELEEPMATALVRWLPASEGGRRSGPPTAPVYAATAVFPIGDEAEVMPGWPGSADQLSILVQRTSTQADGQDTATIGFLAPELARPHLKSDAEFLILEGPKVVASGIVLDLL